MTSSYNHMTMISHFIGKKTPIVFMLLHLWKQPPKEHRFLKNTFAWLLRKSKLYSNFDSMFCLHKVRMLEKGVSAVVCPVICKMMTFAEIMKQPLERFV